MHRRGLVATFFGVFFASVAFLSLYGGAGQLFAAAPALPALPAAILLVLGVVSAVVALGFWWLRPWLLFAARAWLAAATLLFISLFAGPGDSLPIPAFVFLPFGTMLLGFWFVLHYFVREVLDPFS